MQHCYGHGVHFDAEWAQVWAHEELYLWLLSTALNCWFYWLLR